MWLFKAELKFPLITTKLYFSSIFILLFLFISSPALASFPLKGLMLKANDTMWLSVGGGLRFQTATRNSDADDSSEFTINSMRLYISGQLHEYFKFNINTEKYEGDSMMTIDALLKFEFNSSANLWLGRTLVPSDRPGLNGPYSGLTWNQYRQPLFSADYDGPAGQLGRSEGGVFWGTKERFQYLLGVFEGLENDYGNTSNHFLYAGRLAYNFLNIEPQPGHYYTSGTYYGSQGNILTAAVTLQSQNDGTGSKSESGDFSGYAFDIFSERVMLNEGVINFEAGYKEIESDFTFARRPQDITEKCFCLFDGDTFYITAGYLIPEVIGIGKLQPYFRHTKNSPVDAKNSDTSEWGTNYVIADSKANVNLNYTHGDANASGYAGKRRGTVTLGLQLQFY
jgi:hypothetical protein|tara:strand:- start:10538 stop:11725 length:1188 start_codon:yes stop_codon:yes gene_type:complete